MWHQTRGNYGAIDSSNHELLPILETARREATRRSIEEFSVARPLTIAQIPDKYQPVFHAPSRKSSILAGIFNIVCTSLDGTVLTIPYTVSKCGLLVAPLLLICFGMMTVLTLQFVCICSRKIRAVSFTEVVERLLGDSARLLFSGLLFLVLFAIMVGYFVLMRQMSADLLVILFGPEVMLPSVMIVFIFSVCAFPMMLAENLNRLRYSCYLGFASILLVLLSLLWAVCFAGTSENMYHFGKMKWVPGCIGDVLETVPVYTMLYLSHFNVLGVFVQLYQPTQKRMNRVIYTSISVITALFICFGITGYMAFCTLFGGRIDDNILRAFLSHHKPLLVGKLSLVLTLFCTVPLMMVPARVIFLELYGNTCLHCQRLHRRVAMWTRRYSYASDPGPLAQQSMRWRWQYLYSSRNSQPQPQQQQGTSYAEYINLRTLHVACEATPSEEEEEEEEEEDDDDEETAALHTSVSLPVPALLSAETETPPPSYQSVSASALTPSSGNHIPPVGVNGTTKLTTSSTHSSSGNGHYRGGGGGGIYATAAGHNHHSFINRITNSSSSSSSSSIFGRPGRYFMECEEEETQEGGDQENYQVDVESVSLEDPQDQELQHVRSESKCSSMQAPPVSFEGVESHWKEWMDGTTTTVPLAEPEREEREAFLRGPVNSKLPVDSSSIDRDKLVVVGVRTGEEEEEEEEEEAKWMDDVDDADDASYGLGVGSSNVFQPQQQQQQQQQQQRTRNASFSSPAPPPLARQQMNCCCQVLYTLATGLLPSHAPTAAAAGTMHTTNTSSGMSTASSTTGAGRISGAGTMGTGIRSNAAGFNRSELANISGRRELFQRYVTTLFILAVVVVTAEIMPDSVSTVWETAGSSLGLMISTLTPSLLYIRLQSYCAVTQPDVKYVLAWSLLHLSVPLMVACTVHNTSRSVFSRG